MKNILATLIMLYSYTAYSQFLGAITPAVFNVYTCQFGAGIQLNNGTILIANAMHPQPVHNLYPGGGVFAPQTQQTPNSTPVVIKHMSDDRYVVASYHDDLNVGGFDTIEVSRHLADGSYDTAFNGTGRHVLLVDCGQGESDPIYPYDLIVLHDSSVIFTYFNELQLPKRYLFALKLKPNGSIDSTFGVGGIIQLPFDFFRKPGIVLPYRGRNTPMLEVNNQHIYFGGSKDYKSCLIRYNQSGVFDSVYGFKISADTGDISRLVLDYSGDVLAMGCYTTFGWNGLEPYQWFIRKFKPDGTLNTDFGISGEFTIPAYHLTNGFLQADGKIVLFGQYSDQGNIYSIRVHANGTIDNTFAFNTNYWQCGGQQNYAGTAFMQSDGNIVYTVGFETYYCGAGLHVNRLLNNPCGNGNTASSPPVLSANDLNICQAALTDDTIFIVGNLNGASYWEYFTNFNPVPQQVYGNSFTISPNVTTTYYVLGTGYCVANGPVDSITINIYPATSSFTNTTICVNQIPYSWNGLTIDSQGVYTAMFNDINGCDSIATLNLNISVCGLCQNGFTANWSPFTDSLVESSTWISTSGTVLIPVGAKVKFDANVGAYVRLNPGFKAEYGSVFVAQAYNGCTAGAPQLPNAKIFTGEVGMANEIVLYPNPTTGLIHIQHDEKLTNIQIFDMVGKLVINQKCEGETETNIDLSNFPNGVYHVKAVGYESVKVTKSE
jgi:uncharacterized delta-60 repeat protein